MNFFFFVLLFLGEQFTSQSMLLQAIEGEEYVVGYMLTRVCPYDVPIYCSGLLMG